MHGLICITTSFEASLYRPFQRNLPTKSKVVQDQSGKSNQSSKGRGSRRFLDGFLCDGALFWPVNDSLRSEEAQLKSRETAVLPLVWGCRETEKHILPLVNKYLQDRGCEMVYPGTKWLARGLVGAAQRLHRSKKLVTAMVQFSKGNSGGVPWMNVRCRTCETVMMSENSDDGTDPECVGECT